jgi:ubiquinol-cytochrome c reductase cytochrome c subunit
MRALRHVTAFVTPIGRAISKRGRGMASRVRGLSAARRRLLAGPLAVIGVGMLAFSTLVVTGGTSYGAPVASDAVVGNASAGQPLFIEHCQACHGTKGQGGVNGAPALIDVGSAAVDFYLSTGRMPLNNPNDEALRHHAFFNDQQIADIVAYVNQLSGGDKNPIPTILPLCPSAQQNDGIDNAKATCVTLSQGQQNYLLDCAQCHQANASGGMLSKGDIVPSLRDANVTQVAEALRIGPMPMPIFGPKQLDEQQMSAIAQYVQYLHGASHHGGLAIARFGPVAEGFVGIVIGLVALLIFTRLIGTRG